MRVVFVIMVALAVLFAPVSSIAKKGPSDKAYEHASDKAKFKRDPGSFDKTGKKINEEATEQEEEMSEEEKVEKKAEKKAEKKKKKGKKKNKN
jgi:predicted Holliday junction resolvase-like endonuclease